MSPADRLPLRLRERADAGQFSGVVLVADDGKLVTGEPLQFEPGTAQSYSNSGFVVLGAVIEAITGPSYYDYVRASTCSSRPE